MKRYLPRYWRRGAVFTAARVSTWRTMTGAGRLASAVRSQDSGKRRIAKPVDSGINPNG